MKKQTKDLGFCQNRNQRETRNEEAEAEAACSILNRLKQDLSLKRE